MLSSGLGGDSVSTTKLVKGVKDIIVSIADISASLILSDTVATVRTSINSH